MNWHELLQGKVWTWDEIHTKHGFKKQLFNAVRKRLEQQMTKEHEALTKAQGNTHALSDSITQKISNDKKDLKKNWGEESTRAKALEEKYNQEIDTNLVRRYNASQAEKMFSEARKDLDQQNIENWRGNNFEQSIQLQILEVGGQRRLITGEELLAEMRETAEKNRNKGFERGR